MSKLYKKIEYTGNKSYIDIIKEVFKQIIVKNSSMDLFDKIEVQKISIDLITYGDFRFKTCIDIDDTSNSNKNTNEKNEKQIELSVESAIFSDNTIVDEDVINIISDIYIDDFDANDNFDILAKRIIKSRYSDDELKNIIIKQKGYKKEDSNINICNNYEILGGCIIEIKVLLIDFKYENNVYKNVCILNNNDCIIRLDYPMDKNTNIEDEYNYDPFENDANTETLNKLDKILDSIFNESTIKLNTINDNKIENNHYEEENKDRNKQNDKFNMEEIEKELEELNNLVGLENVKKDVKSMVNLITVNNKRKELGLPITPMSYHLVFTGNPGTGKTTVARILAKIYKALGVIENENVVEVDRSELVAGYTGQTAIKTQEIIDSAKGGILFIDEAYTLARGEKEDSFGQEAIDTILKEMEDNRDNLVVIVAGYTDLMKNFISSNPGLESRFNKYIEFADYTPDELYEILELNCKKRGYVLSEDAKKFAKRFFIERYKNRDKNYANARDVRNYFEKAVVNQSTRIVNEGIDNISKDDMVLINDDDIKDIVLK